MKFIIPLILCGLVIIASSCNVNSSRSNKVNSNANINFDPFGYYYPKDTLRIKDCIVDQLSIMTEINKTDKTSSVIDKVFFQLFKPNSDSTVRIIFENFRLENKVLELSTNDKKFGVITFKGRFTGESGPSNDNLDMNSIVLKGSLKIDNGSEQKVEFTWFGGD
jgi:hypothetical protein